MDEIKKEFYTVHEFAQAVGKSKDRVYEWVRTGYINATRITKNSAWLIPISELEKLKQESPPTKEKKPNISATLDNYIADRELAKIKRIYELLIYIRDILNQWLCHYTNCLSCGDSELPDFRTLKHTDTKEWYLKWHRNNLSQIEYIFDTINTYETATFVDNTVFTWDSKETPPAYQYNIHSVRRWLESGLMGSNLIDKRIKRFPSFLDEVNPVVSQIANLSDFMRNNISRIDKWKEEQTTENVSTIERSKENHTIRHILRNLGIEVNDILGAVNEDINKLSSINF